MLTEKQRRVREFVDGQRAARPIEDQIVRMIWKAMKRAGNRIVRVDYGDGEGAPVSSLRQLYDEVFNLDEAWLVPTSGGGYIYLVMGESVDTLADYSMDLDEVLAPLVDEILNRWWP